MTNIYLLMNKIGSLTLCFGFLSIYISFIYKVRVKKAFYLLKVIFVVLSLRNLQKKVDSQ